MFVICELIYQGRNEGYLEMLNQFSVDVPQSAFLINMFPSILHE